MTAKQYLAGVDSLVTDPRRLMLAAMDGGRLLAHLETYAVDGTAYLDEIRLSGDSQSRQVSGFLHQEACQVYRQSGQVTRSGWRRIGDLNP